MSLVSGGGGGGGDYSEGGSEGKDKGVGEKNGRVKAGDDGGREG